MSPKKRNVILQIFAELTVRKKKKRWSYHRIIHPRMTEDSQFQEI
jgi:hypothetical protein